MIHYYVEIALWMSGLYFIGCALGALARRFLDGRRRRSGAA